MNQTVNMSDHRLKEPSASSDDSSSTPPDYDSHLQASVPITRSRQRFTMASYFSWANIKYYIIPVEIVVFFYIYLSLFRFQIFQQYVYQQSARNRLNISSNYFGCLNQTKIVELSDNDTFAAIQDNSKHILMVNTIVSEVPAIFVNMVLGGFADKYGRKPIFFFILTGQLVQTIVELVVVYFNINMYFFVVGGITSGLTGGFAALFLAGYAYIADITPRRWLTIRSGFLQVFIFVGKAASSASSNSWLSSNGCNVLPPLWLLLALGALAVIYSICIPESLSDKRRKELALVPKKGLQAWVTGVKIYFMPYFLGVKRYWKLLVATAAFMLTVINEIGFTQILTYFLQNKPLEWHLDLISVYGTVMSVTHGIVLLIVLPILVLIGLPDALIVLIGVVFTGGVAVFFGFAEHSWPVWLIFIGKEREKWVWEKMER